MPIKLDIGCGYEHRKGYIRIDSCRQCVPDVCIDLTFATLLDYQYAKDAFFSESSIDEIRVYDFLEHIPQPRAMELMHMFWQLLCPDGLLDIRVPSTDGRGAFQNPMHRSFWNRNSFYYYVEESERREIGFKGKFEIQTLYDIPTGQSVIHTYAKLIAKKGQI